MCGLKFVIASLDIEVFVANYWEQQPLLIQRDDPEYFCDILSVAVVDQVLSELTPAHPNIRLARDGATIPLNESPTAREHLGNQLESVYEEYRNGSTIILQFLHDYWKPLGDLCQALRHNLSARVQANVYLTPPHSQGFHPHYDTHDVFILQVAGTKRWRLYESPIGLPLLDEAHRPELHKGIEPTKQFELKAGDTLYVPRGLIHDADSGDTTSLHITIGVNVLTWAFVLERALSASCHEAAPFRKALPPGFANGGKAYKEAKIFLSSLRDTLLGELSSAAVVDGAVELFKAGQRPNLQGHLTDLTQLNCVGLDTTMQRRPNLEFDLDPNLDPGLDQVSLRFHGKTVKLPVHVITDLNFMIEATRFTPADLPGDMDDSGRLVLARSLLREGFLTLL